MRMRRLCLVVFMLALGASIGLVAQSAETPNLGRTPTSRELQNMNILVMPDGLGLPKGRGTAVEGAALYGQRGCGRCHGPNLTEGPAPVLAGRPVSPSSSYYPPAYWPFAPKLYDYINRAMPFDRPGYLSPDEVYALTAFILYRNGIVQESDVMDANSLPKVQMPHRDRYAAPPADWKPGQARLPWRTNPTGSK